MSEQIPTQFDGVSVQCKANVYFQGKVISHGLTFPDGTKKTLGLLYAGEYTFNTDAAERMEIVAGSCTVHLPLPSMKELQNISAHSSNSKVEYGILKCYL